MMGTVRARVRGVVRDAGHTILKAVDDAGREYAVEVPADLEVPPPCSTCGPACGCAPCRLRHAGEHAHDHSELREDLVLILAWSLHALPTVDEREHEHDNDEATGAAAPTTASVREPASASSSPSPANVDAAFMALMGCLHVGLPAKGTSTSAPVADPIAAFFGLAPPGDA